MEKETRMYKNNNENIPSASIWSKLPFLFAAAS